jgi:hypothetical protein
MTRDWSATFGHDVLPNKPPVGTGFLVRFPILTLLDHDGLVFIGSTCCADHFAASSKDGGGATMQCMSIDSSDGIRA